MQSVKGSELYPEIAHIQIGEINHFLFSIVSIICDY